MEYTYTKLCKLHCPQRLLYRKSLYFSIGKVGLSSALFVLLFLLGKSVGFLHLAFLIFPEWLWVGY